MFIKTVTLGVRSYLISTGVDLLLCVATPLVVIYNSSVTRTRLRQLRVNFYVI